MLSINWTNLNQQKKNNWDKEQQSKARNSDGKYRQMALVGFDT